MTTPPQPTSDDGRTRARAAELGELVRLHLPVDISVPDDQSAWPLFGHALLSRMTGSLEAIFLLQPSGRSADAFTLLRSLFEHAVHFAWLAADPSAARLGAWRRNDLNERLRADDDAKQFDILLLTPGDRAAMEYQRDNLPGPKHKLRLDRLAEQADEHWSARIESHGARGDLGTFRGLYAFAYRYHSALAHPGERGLHPVVEDISETRKRVKIEDTFEGRGPYGMATVIYAMALLVSEQTFAWPAATAVDAIFAGSPEL